MFFKYITKKEKSNNLEKIAALLIHAAKIDEDYSIEEEEIIKQALLKSMEGTVADKTIFSRCKAFCESVEDGDIVAKHSEEDVPSSNKNSDDIPF